MRDVRYYVADLETTSYPGQTATDVWAAAIVEIGTDKVYVYNNLDALMAQIFSLPDRSVVYFHNLKFDGEFICAWLAHHDWRVSWDGVGICRRPKDMLPQTYGPLISAQGQWYEIVMKTPQWTTVTVMDSLKLIPLSVREMGRAFQTSHQKSEIEYTVHRHGHEPISVTEKQYIINDVLVVAEAMGQFRQMVDAHMTIGGTCMAAYRQIAEQSGIQWALQFPALEKIQLDDNVYGSPTAESYIRRAYRGGWTYVAPEKQRIPVGAGCTYDVNSLYPSVMLSASGNVYPIGRPTFWRGDIPQGVETDPDIYYFLRVRCRFRLRPGYLPTVQIKQDARYNPRQMLTTSDITMPDGTTASRLWDAEAGRWEDIRPVITMTGTDWRLMREHYALSDVQILDGCYFLATDTLFDDYIRPWEEIKRTSTGGMRQIAKLFLNNLYGKFATRADSDYKVPVLNPDTDVMTYKTVFAADKTPGYIAIGAAVTAYARNVTIRAAQANYHGSAPGFCYADTDSMHLDLPAEAVKGIDIDDTRFGAWKLEGAWIRARFVRAKCYVEEMTDEKYNIKCAGMPKSCKDYVSNALAGTPPEIGDCTDDERAFYYPDGENFQKMTMNEFDYGLTVPGKLLPKRLPGGVVLADTIYTMRPNGGYYG